ncbi:MAG: glycosyltransferase [Candidatus Methylacidiphilales bacterium]
MSSHKVQPPTPDRVLVIIPALNEAEALPGVLAGLNQAGFQRIRVVDNGSTDGTADVARRLGAEVVEERRRGYGQACWTGTRNVPDDVDWFLFCDADGSDDPADFPKILEAATQSGVGYVQGNRRATAGGRGALTAVQNFGNALASLLIRMIWGTAFSDLGPLRLIHRPLFDQLEMEDRGFGWTVEMQAKVAAQHIPHCEIPVAYRPRQGGVSKISGTVRGSVMAGVVILGTLGSLFLRECLVQRLLWVISSLLLLLGAWKMSLHGDFRIPGTVYSFWAGVGLAGAGFMLSFGLRSVGWLRFWVVALLARLVLLPMVPGDDIWRYLWEGMIQWHGHCPYTTPPSSVILEGLRTDYWAQINHRDIPAIYPPVVQWIFKWLSAVSQEVWLFKGSFILADLACAWLLAHRFGHRAALLYAWNPMVLYHFAGGGHYDSLFVLPIVAAWLVVEGRDTISWKRWMACGVLLGISAGIKWMSLPLLAWAGWRVWSDLGWRRAIAFSIFSALPFLVALIAVCRGVPWAELIPHEFAMYARSAEFFPRIIEAFWPASARMNWLYLIPLGIAALVIVFRVCSFQRAAEQLFFWIFLFSPAVHAWYFTWLVPFAVKSRHLGLVMVSLSSFIYFILQERTATWVQGDANPWRLDLLEWLLMWAPFVLGWLWMEWKQRCDRLRLGGKGVS